MIGRRVKFPMCGLDEHGVVSCKVGRTRFVNLLPHPVTVQTKERGAINIPESGKVLRLKTHVTLVKKIEGIPTVKIEFGDPEWTPEKRENTYYIVSNPVIERSPREDFIAPDVTEESAVRSPSIKKQIIAVRRWRAG